MKSGKTICALLTAAAVGATVGLLFTEKGKKLRGKLANLKSEDLNNLKEKINEFTGTNILDSGTSNDPV